MSPPSFYFCRGRKVPANFFDRLRALVLSVFLIAAFAVPALAGPFEDAVAKFANDEFSDTDEAIGAVATSGNPLAFPIISALQDGRLSADPESKKVFVTGADGKIIDAATGAAVASLPAGAAAVRLNNKLRRVVEAALGGLTLLSPDLAKRIAAAQSVLKTHDETMLPVIDGALAKETNKAAKAGLYRGPRRHPALQARCHRRREAGGHRHHQGARRSGSAGAVDRTWAATSRRWWRRPRPARPRRSRAILRCGRWCRTPGTACRWARCCCSPRSGLPSPSA